MDFVEAKLTDVGTRFRHWSDLLEAWESGLEITKRHSTQTDHDKERVTQLETGIELLRKQIEVCGRFDAMRWKYFDQVGVIPKDPAKIEGGRGTPLGAKVE